MLVPIQETSVQVLLQQRVFIAIAERGLLSSEPLHRRRVLAVLRGRIQGSLGRLCWPSAVCVLQARIRLLDPRCASIARPERTQ